MVHCTSGAGTCAKVQFKSDAFVTNRGFKINVQLVDEGNVSLSRLNFSLRLFVFLSLSFISVFHSFSIFPFPTSLFAFQFLCLHLYFSLSLYLSCSFFVFLGVCVCVCIPFSLSLSICLSASPCFSFSICLTLSLSLFLKMYPSSWYRHQDKRLLWLRLSLHLFAFRRFECIMNEFSLRCILPRYRRVSAEPLCSWRGV